MDNDERVKEMTLVTGIDAPALTPTRSPCSHHPSTNQPIGGIDDLQQQQAHRAHADMALQLATRAAHGQLTTPDEQAAFLAERLTSAREEIVDAATAPPPTWRRGPSRQSRGRPKAS